MRLNQMTVLSESEIRQINEATIEILSNSGVKVLGKRMRERLCAIGLPVDGTTEVIRLPRSVLEGALERIPPKIEVFNRENEPAFVLGDGVPKIAAGHNAVFWVDAGTGERRTSRVEDVRRFARLCEQIPEIDMIGIPVMPQDVQTPRATLLHAVAATVENSRKPIFFSTYNAVVNRGCIELLKSAFAGDFQDRVYGISQLSPTSPLYLEENVCEAILDTLETHVPLAILPEPNAGVSAPFTLAGLITMNNAECLAGLAIIQLLKPGHPVMYANSWTTTDMRNGAALVGSIETSICRIAGAQMARFYNVPSHTTAPNSDNHAHDEQNAWEKTFSLLAAAGAGNDLIVNCGMFATGLTCSDEQLLMDAEIAGMCQRLCAGVEVTPETVAAGLIQEVGPQGDTYLTQAHTLKWLRSGEYYATHLAVRGSFAAWQADGGRDTAAIAREMAIDLAKRPVTGLDSQRLEKINEVLAAFESQLGEV
jgi:trimethylamine--corrinoid protein Co-methyltransferase